MLDKGFYSKEFHGALQRIFALSRDEYECMLACACDHVQFKSKVFAYMH